MSGSFSLLLGYCLAMFLGAYAAGWVTTAMAGGGGSGGPRLVRRIAVFGAGLLVGTALVVIIPEGVAMYYEAAAAEASALASAGARAAHAHAHVRALAAAARGVAAAAGDAGAGAARLLGDVPHSALRASASDAAAGLGGAGGAHAHEEGEDGGAGGAGGGGAHGHSHGGGAIGASLVFGFAFQLLVGAWRAAVRVRPAAMPRRPFSLSQCLPLPLSSTRRPLCGRAARARPRARGARKRRRRQRGRRRRRRRQLQRRH
jgi:hypothetical protein